MDKRLSEDAKNKIIIEHYRSLKKALVAILKAVPSRIKQGLLKESLLKIYQNCSMFEFHNDKENLLPMVGPVFVWLMRISKVRAEARILAANTKYARFMKEPTHVLTASDGIWYRTVIMNFKELTESLNLLDQKEYSEPLIPSPTRIKNFFLNPWARVN